MKLTLITENNQILQQTAEKLKIHIDKLNKLITDADPTGRKYKLFILKLLNKNNIRLPEDNYRVKETLNNFRKYQRNLEFKDILKYDSLHDLEAALEPYIGSVSKKQGGNNVNPLSLPGVELVLDNGEFKTYKVSDIESLKDIGEGTKWCTRRSYPDCQAEYYIDTYNWIGVVYKNGKPFIQYTSDYEQVMDVNDLAVKFNTSDIIPKPNLDDDIMEILNYSRNILKGRWLEAEPIIMKDKSSIIEYSQHAIRGRWFEAEPIILKSTLYSYVYAFSVIKGRWPEAERLFKQSAEYAFKYAAQIIQGQWPEGEQAISGSPEYSYFYARDVLYDRFKKGEPVILNEAIADPRRAHIVPYMRDVVRGRWPEAEHIIIKYPEMAYIYAKYSLKGRWVEAEPIILNSTFKRDYLDDINRF